MSAAVDFALHNLGRHTHLDGMAQHHSYHEPYTPAHGHYAPEHRLQHPSQARQLPRLPPMATLIPPAASNPSPVLANGRDAPYHVGRPTVHYSDYATPSPVGQTPPQLPIPNSDPNPMSKRPVDIRRSPTLSSTASDRSSEEMAQESRLRQMSSLHDYSQGSVPRQLMQYPSPRSRGGSLQHDSVLPTVQAKASQAGPYSSPSAALPNGRPTASQHPRSPSSTQLSPSPRPEPKSMSISNLLSSSSSATTTITTTESASNKTITTNPIPPPSATPNSTYRITVRQQPLAARSCGFGERDRRVIDPPPIVQLTIHDPSLSPPAVSQRLRHQFSVVHCSIWDERGESDMSSMPEDFRQQRRLMGTLVASPFVGVDETGEEGCFFCFPDLSCRTPGVFRLKFALVVLDPARMVVGERSAIVATVMSERFQVFNAKDFPGMQASTTLTKRLKEQGCLISIKKGNEKREVGGGGDGGKGIGGEDEEDEEGEGEMGEEGGGGKNGNGGEGKLRTRKRVKR
ncbi:hypothetical protein N657DRAFT_446666 [Parathielavia appendiculata]|uniref:Velvet domain-containing protein n=1 Tax=Parathielavia appendiculata TaxID=2587402 RepID=A0AAN6TYI0_9PEZI|nr:hypothetical protein N657DRAFT_446666 [Parathielavia appendiculata]